MAELWGSLSVDDHLGSRALVGAVLLFDRLVMPVPPVDDDNEMDRWRERWEPARQRRMIDILGSGGGEDDLVVEVPWTPARRDEWRAMSAAIGQPVGEGAGEREVMLRGLRRDAATLQQPDGAGLTRMVLADEHHYRPYADRQPKTHVEAVVPAYGSFARANAELGLRTIDEQPAEQSLSPTWIVGWELLVPEDNDWSDEKALDEAAQLARSQAYRDARLGMRDWWRNQIMTGIPPQNALEDLLDRAERLKTATTQDRQRTTTLRAFVVIGGVTAALGAWCPPVALAGGLIAAAAAAAEWVWPENPAAASLAPAAMFTDIRRQFGWEEQHA